MVQLTSTCLLLPLLLSLLAGLECAATTLLAHKEDAVVANEGNRLETVKEQLLHKTKKVADGTRIKIGGAAEDVQEEEGEKSEENTGTSRSYNVGKCRHGCQVIMSDAGLKSSSLSFGSDYHMAKRHPPKNN